MSFISREFLILFAIVLAIRIVVGRRTNSSAYVALLILSSLVFYAWHVPVYLVILLASTSVDYAAALALGRLPGPEHLRRRLVLAASLGTNLGLLGFFKYGRFFVRGVGHAVALAGFQPNLQIPDLVLPIGISFYTFEAMSYTIDVYRGRMAPIRSFPRFVLFISFFPHLVAGPIVRAWQFLPQLNRRRRMRLIVIYEALWLIITGYFLKTVVADNLAAYVNANWDQAYRPNAGALTCAGVALMFSGQIFADFAGYSNIARGLAYLLGYRLPMNFNAPYLAGSFRNFWQRWHMTLSAWLRDYLYVSLGGNRLSAARTYLNLMIVMTLGGLWHGAALTFVAWGALHGLALAIERAVGLHRGVAPRLLRVVWFVVVQLIVVVAWVFFRSDTIAHALRFIGNVIASPAGTRPEWTRAALVLLSPVAAWHAWTWLDERGLLARAMPVGRIVVATMMAWAIFAMRGQPSAFIYFQF